MPRLGLGGTLCGTQIYVLENMFELDCDRVFKHHEKHYRVTGKSLHLLQSLRFSCLCLSYLKRTCALVPYIEL